MSWGNISWLAFLACWYPSREYDITGEMWMHYSHSGFKLTVGFSCKRWKGSIRLCYQTDKNNSVVICSLSLCVYVCVWLYVLVKHYKHIYTFIPWCVKCLPNSPPFQKKPARSGPGGSQSSQSSARPLLMRTFSDESNTVIWTGTRPTNHRPFYRPKLTGLFSSKCCPGSHECW